MVNIQTLMQFLYEGDFLGFIQAIYVSGFQSADVFYGVVTMLFAVPLYIRTHSLLFMCILWVLLGSFFLVAMPIVSGIAVLLMTFGIAGMLFKLYMQVKS